MITSPISRSFRFLTPAFAHGAYQAQSENIPELRAPSIRGQLRQWWRMLGYGHGNECFGSVSGSDGMASKIQVRLIGPSEPRICTSEILPHKENPRHRGFKNAIQANADIFTIELRTIRGGLGKEAEERLENTLNAWLLMGGVGQRSNRSAGSPWPEEHAPTTIPDYLSRCRNLLSRSKVRVAVLDIALRSANEVRDLSGRFLGNGRVPGNVFGSADPRKSSSLKLRAVELDDALRIAAIWHPKNAEDTPNNLRLAVSQMKQIEAKAELARLIENALPDLIG